MKEVTNKWLELIIVLSAPLLSVIDVFIINIGIPTIKKGIHATDAEIQLVIAGYLLGYAAFLITGGRAGDYFGRKKVFFWGMLAFTIASCFCGLSTSALQLNVTRFFQGLSASFMVPQTIAFIQVLFTDTKERAKAFGLFGITLGTAAVIGQVLGGYLSDTHWAIEGWRLMFFINLPIGVLTLWATHKYVTETKNAQGSKFDYSGILILTTALFCLIYPLIQGREAGWPLWSIGLMALSIGIFVFFISNQKRKLARNENPLIDVRLVYDQWFQYRISSGAVSFYAAHGISAIERGISSKRPRCFRFVLRVVFCHPGPLSIASFIVASKLIVRSGKRVLQVGVVLLAVAFYLQMEFWKPGISPWLIIGLMGIWGLGNGLVLPSLLNIALKNVPTQYAGAAAGIYSTFQQTASALGVSIIGGVFFYYAKDGWQVAFHAGTIGLLVCTVLVGIMLYLLPDGREISSNSPSAVKMEDQFIPAE